MIGAKSLSIVALVGLAAIAAWLTGMLSPPQILARGPGALWFAGTFGILVGTWVFRFWRLDRPSRQYFRLTADLAPWDDEAHFIGGQRLRVTLGENHGQALDLPRWTLYLSSLALGLLVALASIDSRSLSLIGKFERGLTMTSGTCRPPEQEHVVVNVNLPGCELIRRAFALGYAKSLGDCGGAVQAGPTTTCTLRQWDEPFSHYAFRLLTTFWDQTRGYLGPGPWQKMKAEFDQRLVHLRAISTSEARILASAPHAAHHIWTNLPDPEDGAFKEQTCADRYRFLSHRPPSSTKLEASRIFEHIVGQLLFESRYEPAAGYCREYHVHWAASPEACQRLAADPEAFLDQSGATASIAQTLDRYRLTKEGGRNLDPSALVSFQCYLEGPSASYRVLPFKWKGESFAATELSIPPAPPGAPLHSDRYDAIGRLLVRGFHYGSFLSEAGLSQETEVESAPHPSSMLAFAGQTFVLTRLYGLESHDIYLSPGWLAARPDLLEVYPYQVHLKNYVRVFRHQYRTQRGRL